LKDELKSITVGDQELDEQVQNRSQSPSNIRDKLISKISDQGDKIRQLKSTKATKAVIDSEVKVLLALKSEFKSVTGEEWQPGLQSAISIAQKELPGEQLSSKIIEQGDIVRKLKSEKATKEIIDAEVKILLALKAQYKSVTGIEWKPLSNKPEPAAAMADQDGKSEESEVDVLTLKITEQGNIVRKLKSSGGDKVSTLLLLFTHL
jgi:bifunctional glutamyl/prolyl-tRNA synthetase